MDSTMSFRRIWESMSLPPNEESTTISPVTGTNAYLTKSYDGSMGLYLRDITDQLPRRRYMHLEISMLREKEVRLSGGRVKRLRNLLFLDADRSVKSPALALILEGLHDHSETGEFTASEMISVLDEVEELLRRPRGLPTIEEVAGAWGELYILRMLIQNASDSETQLAIISGWEGEARERLDFRFPHASQALEVKTTMSRERIHHLHGMEQVSLPEGFDHGVLASLCIEAEQGVSCKSILDSIEALSLGSPDEKRRIDELLARRITVRGAACYDDRHCFELIRDGLMFYHFSEVPSPGEAEGVSSIEWLSDLTNAVPLASSERDGLVARITKPRPA